MARVEYAFCAAGNFLSPLVVFGISWAVSKWLLGDGNPNWGTPLMWASGAGIFWAYQLASIPPSDRPKDASHPNILPLTTAHLAIKTGSAAFYTVIFGLLLGVATKSILGPTLWVVVTAGLILFALNRYRTLYYGYCRDYIVFDPNADPNTAPKTSPD